MSAGNSRLAFIDALKAIASQLIVLHHLAFYGPMSDYAHPLAPELFSWLSQYARIAVQAFLVIGGFLAVQSIAPTGRFVQKPVPAILWKRYLKLVPPYVCALLLAIAAAPIAESLTTHESIPAPPTAAQFIAHVFLLQSVLGFDGLSAGVWYIAIDFQLYALLLLTLWLANSAMPQHFATAGRALLIALVLASLFYFNRNDGWDNWAVYFFGAYGLGALVSWGTSRNQAPLWLGLVFVAALTTLALDFRSRIALALMVAFVLCIGRYTGFIESWPKSRFIGWLGQISYSVFLVHFPICMIINGLFDRYAPHTPDIQLIGVIVGWLVSTTGGALFYYQVECRAQKLFAKSRA